MSEIRENLLNNVSSTNTGGNPYEIDLDPFAEAVSEGVGSAWESIKETGNGLIDSVSESSFGKWLRGADGPPEGGEPQQDAEDGSATWGATSAQKLDWRVRLSIAPGMMDSTIFGPFASTDNCLVFPYTPSIILSNSASYTPIKPIHSNYPFYAYQNSQVDNITVTGDFTVENFEDGKYWIATIHYLRSITKMAYGKTPNVGSPPPVVYFNGYGEFVFNNVPVVVSNFTCELPSDVDYIQIGGTISGTHVPTKSTISVTLIPMYSRRQIKKFSLQKFVKGSLRKKGFI